MEGAKTAPVDGAWSRRLSGSVYSLRIFPLPAERHPQQQRDHLQRPAQIAEIMHFPPRPDLSGRAADPGVMHAAAGLLHFHSKKTHNVTMLTTQHKPPNLGTA